MDVSGLAEAIHIATNTWIAALAFATKRGRFGRGMTVRVQIGAAEDGRIVMSRVKAFTTFTIAAIVAIAGMVVLADVDMRQTLIGGLNVVLGFGVACAILPRSTG